MYNRILVVGDVIYKLENCIYQTKYPMAVTSAGVEEYQVV